MPNHVETGERDFELGIRPFRYVDLYRPAKLRELLAAFDQEVARADPTLSAELSEARRSPAFPTEPKAAAARSELLIRLGHHVGHFVARLFRVEVELEEQRRRIQAEDVVFRVKRDFLQKRALKRKAAEGEVVSAADLPELDGALDRIGRALLPGYDEVRVEDRDRAAAIVIDELMQLDAAHDDVRAGRTTALPPAAAERDAALRQHLEGLGAGADGIGQLLAACDRWARARKAVEQAKPAQHRAPMFRAPEPMDYGKLVELRRPSRELPELFDGPTETRRLRDGFELTDTRMDAAQRAARGPLLPVLPRARQGLLREGAARQGRHDQGQSARRAARRLPARREDLRDAPPQARRPSASAPWR